MPRANGSQKGEIDALRLESQLVVSCRGLNLGPLKEHLVFLTTEPSIQTLHLFILPIVQLDEITKLLLTQGRWKDEKQNLLITRSHLKKQNKDSDSDHLCKLFALYGSYVNCGKPVLIT